mmetsp:Transcript_1139/g.1883  ORF Transcript_1139/g.1883 Transcript_1139/m.1883 type:complete len:438 (-) Transcript_1139:21-1334(-)
MELNTIVKQLETFSGSIVQILTVLESLYSSSNSDSDKNNSSQGLHDTKFEIYETIISLNQILYSHQFGSTTLFPGSLVLAPRFFEGNMCLDIAIVILIKSATNDAEKFVSEDNHASSISTTESDVYIKNSNQNMKVVWLRPHSRYELLSSSITFSDSQLDITNISNVLQEQQQSIHKLIPGDMVLFISLLNDCHYGTWRKGIVQKITNEGEYVHIEPMSKSTSSHDSIGSLVLPLKITFVAPWPSQSKKSPLQGQQSLSRRGIYGEGYSSDDESTACEGITSIPSLYGAMLSNVAASAASAPQSLGLWEQHTKGFGGRMLAKMGFVRGGRCGLGKLGQGMVQPLAGPGRSQGSEGLGLEGQGKAGSEEERRHRIVKNFNAQLQRRKSVGNKKLPPPEEPSCVFGFLNSLEARASPKDPPCQPPPPLKLATRPSKHVF